MEALFSLCSIKALLRLIQGSVEEVGGGLAHRRSAALLRLYYGSFQAPLRL